MKYNSGFDQMYRKITLYQVQKGQLFRTAQIMCRTVL